MVSSRSSPNLNRGESGAVAAAGLPLRTLAPEKPLSRSSSSILDEPEKNVGRGHPALDPRPGGNGGAPPPPPPPCLDGIAPRDDRLGQWNFHPQTSNKPDPRRVSGMSVSRELSFTASPSVSTHHANNHHHHHHHPGMSFQSEAPVPNSLTNLRSVPNLQSSDYHCGSRASVPDKYGSAAASHAEYKNRDAQRVVVHSVSSSSTSLSPSSCQPYENVSLTASATLRRDGEKGEGRKGGEGVSSSSSSSFSVISPARPLCDPSGLQYSKRLSPAPPSTQDSTQPLPYRSPPGSLPLSGPVADPKRADKSTSPLASPHSFLLLPGDTPSPPSPSPAPRDRPHRDFAAVPPKQASGSALPVSKAAAGVIVRSTPYYNTSTQTELSAYALKTSDPRGAPPQCSVQIQVDDADTQPTRPPRKSVEEKSIQARMSREFQSCDLDSLAGPPAKKSPDFHPPSVDLTGARKSQPEEKNYFQYPFEGMKTIQEKYGVDDQAVGSCRESAGFAGPESGDQVSIMRQLSEEFYRSGARGGAGDRPPGSSPRLEHAFKPVDSSTTPESWNLKAPKSGAATLPSQSVGPFTRQLSSSQIATADRHPDLPAGSRTDLRLPSPGSQENRDYFPGASSRPLQESRKFKSLSAISHTREASGANLGLSLTQSQEFLGPDLAWSAGSRRTPSESERGTSYAPKSPSSTSPHASFDNVASHRNPKLGTIGSSTALTPGHGRTQSVDSLLSERAGEDRREKAQDHRTPLDGSSGDLKKTNTDMVGRKPSMKKAYGIYDDLSSLTKSVELGPDPSNKGKGAGTDSVELGQIQEEGDAVFAPSSKTPQRPKELLRHRTHGDLSDPPHSLDNSWKDDLDRRTGRFQNRTTSELILSPRDRSAKAYEAFSPSSSHRPPRLFDGSIDSGVGSEISCRADGMVTPSETTTTATTTPRSSSFLPLDNPTGAELKQIQQQAVLSFLQRKTGKSFHSPEASLHEPVRRGVAPEPKPADPVADLISRTNATLARRADSIRRSSSIRSTSSSLEQVEVSRSRKETEWSRLRSSDSFNYGSNRSSLCSDNTYEDISVFAPSTPRGSVLEASVTGAENTKNSAGQSGSHHYQRSNTDSGVMTSTTAYQNIPGPPPRRRPPPPPPRSPSPEPGPPPALPPRNYGPPRREEAAGPAKPPPDPRAQGDADSDSKLDFRSVLQQGREKLSPREDAYTAQLRKLDVQFSGLRGSSVSSTSSSSSAAPTSMSVLHSRTPMSFSTTYKRQPTLAQEATPPPPSVVVAATTTGSVSMTPSVSSTTSSLAARASSPHHHQHPHPHHHQQQQHHLMDLISSVESHLSVSIVSSQTKDSPPPPSVKGVVDRDTKPGSGPLSSAKPPQLPERTVLPPREPRPPLARSDQPSSLWADPSKAVSDFQAKVAVDRKFRPPPPQPEVLPRDRKPGEGHVQGHVLPDGGSASPLKDSSRSPAGRRRDVPPPPPSPGKDDGDGVGVMGVVELSQLPPPPPELLGDAGVGELSGTEDQKKEQFADDSYGAYRNRGNRQVGTYKRSSSAALLRPDNQHLKAATDAQAMFGDRRLGNQAWNSDTQLQANRKADAEQRGGSGAPQRPPDRAANPPADGGPARNVGRVSGVAQSSMPAGHGQAPGRGRDEGKGLAGQSFRVEQSSSAVAEKEILNSYDSAQPGRLVILADKTVSPSSSSSSVPSPGSPLRTSPTPSSSGQRWANAMPFPAVHRMAADDVKPHPVSTVPGSPHNHRAANSQPASDRPSVSSTHSNPASRSRILSDRSRHGDLSPPSDITQRSYAEVAPFASDPRALPGHVRTYSQSSDSSRSAPSPYNRREGSLASHVPPEAIAMVSPRRKSEDQLLSSDAAEMEKETGSDPVLISHGRQPSQEELECDQRAKELALEVADSEKKLSDVLNADAGKKRMEYLNGIFAEPVDVKIHASVRGKQCSQSSVDVPGTKAQMSNSASVDEDPLKKRSPVPFKPWLSTPGVTAERKQESPDPTGTTPDSDTLVRHKEEVMEKLHKKLELLREEKKGLQEEMDDNKALGKRICEAVDSKCLNPGERDKFHTYINDVEKIVRLLLNLSGQLARAEKAVQAADGEADPEIKKRAVEKCEGLRTKHAEAKQLKEHVDKRSDQVSGILRQWLSGEELKDYGRFVSLQSKLTIHLQQLEDEISLGLEQVQELKKSMVEQAATTHPSSVSSSSSPVPVSS